MNQGSKNKVPGAIRANKVSVAGQVRRCQEIAKAAGMAKANPSYVDPPAT